MMRRPGYDDVISFKHDGQILQSVLICIDLHGSIAAERLKISALLFILSALVKYISLWLRETKVINNIPMLKFIQRHILT